MRKVPAFANPTPVLRLLSFLSLLLIFFANYRACESATPVPRTDVVPTSFLPKMPQGGQGEGAAIATLSLSQAPRYVQRVVQHLRSIKNFRPLQGFKGGRQFKNREGILPQGKTYYEFDVHPLRPELSRGAERLVVDQSKQFFYFTKDHYTTFTQILLP